MIPQAFLDFLRDTLNNWIRGINVLTVDMDPSAAGSAIGGVGAQASAFIALFISPSVWGSIIAMWAIWIGVWLTTGAIAIVSRRGKST